MPCANGRAALPRGMARLRGRAIFGDTVAVVAAQIWSKGVVYGVTLLMARYLDVTAFATFNYFLLTSALLAGYLGMGLPLATTKLIAGAGEDGEEGRYRAMAALLAIALATTLLACLAAPLYLPLIVSDELPLSGTWIIAAAALGSFSALGQTALYAVRQFKWALVPNLLGSVVFVAGAVAATRAGEVEPLLIGGVIAPVVTGAGLFILLRRYRVLPPGNPLRRLAPALIRQAIGVALPGFGLSVLSVTWNWLVARSLLEQGNSAEDFAIFAIALQWFALLMLIPLGASQAVFPRYVDMATHRHIHWGAVLTPAVGLFAALLALAPLAYLAAPLLTWVYGSQYNFPPDLLCVVTITAAISAPQSLLATAVIAWHGAGTWLLANVLALAVCLASLHVAPPQTGFAAFAILLLTISTLLMSALLLLWLADRRSGPATGEARPTTSGLE